MRVPIPTDKLLHLTMGASIALVFAALAASTGYAALAGPLGMAAASAAGLLKELLDWHQNRQALRAGLPAPHTVEPLDVVATALGGAAIYAAWATGVAGA